VRWAAGGASFAVSGKAYGYDDLLKQVRQGTGSAKLRGVAAPPIILRADFRVPYRTVQQFMFDCAQAGIDRFDFQAETGGEGPR
jgi:biopolymer transport protein ExbD